MNLVNLEKPKRMVNLISPTHMLSANPMVRTMRERKFRLLSLYGHLRLCHVLVHRLSRLKRISEKKLVSLLMFLSVIAYLMNCLEVETSSYLMPYRCLRNWSSVHIVSGIIRFLIQLMTAMCFLDIYNRSLMKNGWLCLSCKLTKLPSPFIRKGAHSARTSQRS